MKESYSLSVRQEREIDCLPQLPKDNLSVVTLNTQLHKKLLMLVYLKVSYLHIAYSVFYSLSVFRGSVNGSPLNLRGHLPL